jgi:hypothetical protein
VIRVNSEEEHGGIATAARTLVLNTKLDIFLKENCIPCTTFVIEKLEV